MKQKANGNCQESQQDKPWSSTISKEPEPEEENGYSGSSLIKFYTIWNADIPTGIPIDMLTHTTLAS